MGIIIENKPEAFTEEEIIEMYESNKDLKQYSEKHEPKKGCKAWCIEFDFVLILGYDSEPTGEVHITRFVNDATG